MPGVELYIISKTVKLNGIELNRYRCRFCDIRVGYMTMAFGHMTGTWPAQPIRRLLGFPNFLEARGILALFLSGLWRGKTCTNLYYPLTFLLSTLIFTLFLLGLWLDKTCTNQYLTLILFLPTYSLQQLLASTPCQARKYISLLLLFPHCITPNTSP